MEKNWTTVELLRHARHDWLNKIQLIKGNMSIGKMDRVEAIIEEIIMDAQMLYGRQPFHCRHLRLSRKS